MIVFVHGVPETSAIWDEVREQIDRPSTAVALPGFGVPRPAGFSSTKEEYVDWLAAQIDDMGEPVDLVGHDWGAMLVCRLATTLGTDRLRSWAVDVANLLHPDYEWHPFAQLWQTPGAGEEFFATQLAQPVEDRAAAVQGFGLTAEQARTMAGWATPEMAASILALYRSATPNLHHHWGQALGPTKAPGLVLDVEDDPFGDPTRSAEVAAALGARVERLEGGGHFWPFQAPDRAAAMLRAFWDSLAP